MRLNRANGTYSAAAGQYWFVWSSAPNTKSRPKAIRMYVAPSRSSGRQRRPSLRYPDPEGQQRQQIAEEQSNQEEQQQAALQRNLTDDDAQPDDQPDMDLKRGGKGQTQVSRRARQAGKGWAEQDGYRATGIAGPEE